MVDITDLKSVGLRSLPVQVRPRVPLTSMKFFAMYKVLRIHLLFLFLAFGLLFANIANADEDYIGAEDIGQELPKITIKANPDNISSNVGYSSESPSQMATWTDTEYYTNGDDSGFYIEITGGWNPWGEDTSDTSNMWCITTTENKYSNEIDTTNSEFDYINSSYKISKDQYGNYSTETQPAESQKKCWLTGGTGLYIGFFGSTGYEEPDFATHLKAVDIACDNNNWTDSNDDGIMTVDECIDENGNNVAYYKDYFSSEPNSSSYIKGYAKCPLSTFTGDPKHIKVNECYETIDDKQYNRIRFVFEAQFLYKNSTKSIVGKNEKIKFTILDNYYSDNSGEYNLTIYKGAATNRTEGILEMMVRKIEEAFSVSLDYNSSKQSVNSASLNGKKSSSSLEDTYEKRFSMIKRFYLYIVKDSSFMTVVRIFIALYISFLGLRVAMGTSEYSIKELLNLLLKLTFILGFTTEVGWTIYSKFIVRFFLVGLMSIIMTIINIINGLYLIGDTSSEVRYFDIESGTLSQIFSGIDSTIMSLFTKTVTIKIQALFWGHWYGFLLVLIIYVLIFYFLYQILNASFPIIISYVQLILGLMVGPIFICLYLFKTTEHMFKNWLSFLCARIANIIFIVLLLTTFTTIIKKQFNILLNFPVQKTFNILTVLNIPASIVRAIFYNTGNIFKVYTPVNRDFSSFSDKIIQLIIIYVLIFMFGKLAKMIPTIVDSMVKVGDGDGGKLGKTAGNSTFSETISKSFKNFSNSDKGPVKSILRYVGFTKDNIKSNIYNVTVNGWHKIKNKHNRYKAIGENHSGTSKDKIDSMIETFRKNDYSEKKILKYYNEKKISKYRKKLEKDFLLKSASRLEEMKLEFREYEDLLNNQAVINRLLYSDVLGVAAENGKYDRYIKKITNATFNDSDYDEDKFLELQERFLLSKKASEEQKNISDIRKRLSKFKGVDYMDELKGFESELDKLSLDKVIDKLKYFNEFEEVLREVNDLDGISQGFLMSGIDINNFGLPGASGFTAMSGISNINSFLGFYSGAGNIAGGMGIKLTDSIEVDEEYLGGLIKRTGLKPKEWIKKPNTIDIIKLLIADRRIALKKAEVYDILEKEKMRPELLNKTSFSGKERKVFGRIYEISKEVRKYREDTKEKSELQYDYSWNFEKFVKLGLEKENEHAKT